MRACTLLTEQRLSPPAHAPSSSLTSVHLLASGLLLSFLSLRLSSNLGSAVLSKSPSRETPLAPLSLLQPEEQIVLTRLVLSFQDQIIEKSAVVPRASSALAEWCGPQGPSQLALWSASF